MKIIHDFWLKNTQLVGFGLQSYSVSTKTIRYHLIFQSTKLKFNNRALSSLTGLIAPVRMSAYCISKYGVEAFSDALRREMSPWGVLVSIIEPGRFKTNVQAPILESVKRLWNDLSPELKEDYGEEYFHKCKSYYRILYFFPTDNPQPSRSQSKYTGSAIAQFRYFKIQPKTIDITTNEALEKKLHKLYSLFPEASYGGLLF